MGYLPSIVLGLVVAITTFPFLAYLQYPTEIRKGKVKVIRREIALFLLNFAFIEFILLICRQTLTVATFTSIIVSLATSLLKAYTARLWRTVLTKPR